MVVRYDQNHRIFYVSDLFCKVSGYHREELIGRSYDVFEKDYVNPSLFAEIKEIVVKNNGVWRGQIERISKTGEHYWADTTITTVQDENGKILETIFFALDITKQKEHERKFDLAQNAGKIGNWSFSFTDRKMIWSDHVYELFQQEKAKGPLSYEELRARLHPEDRSHWDRDFAAATAAGQDFNTRLRSLKDGNVRWFDVYASPVIENGVLTGYVGISQGVDERVGVEHGLRDERALLQSILDHMPAVVYSKTIDGRFILANRSFFEVVPGSSPAIIGQTLFDVMPRETALEHHANDQEIARSRMVNHHVEHVPQNDGSTKYFDSYKFPLFDEAGNVTAVSGISIDITERHLIQNKLNLQQAMVLHQARLASIGELAAGVGHEINNPLTIISSYMGQLEQSLKQGTGTLARNLELVDRASRACERIKNIVGGLRTFARASQDAKVPFSLARPILNSVNMIKEIYFKDGIDLSVSLPEEKVTVLGDEGHIQQVIMSLLTNARDALTATPNKRIRIRLEIENGEAVLTVHDTGCGIDPTLQSRVFDPFFTTKSSAKATGLGLSIASSIVKDHGGRLTVESSPATGTKFHIAIPVFASTEAATTISAPQPLANSRQAKILIADDEQDICEILAMILENMGYAVETAENGEVALEKLMASRFDALITDMNMPRLRGLDLIQKLREAEAFIDLKIFLITGGLNVDLSTHPGIDEKIDGYFYKPFDQGTLKTTLFEKLGL